MDSVHKCSSGNDVESDNLDMFPLTQKCQGDVNTTALCVCER